MDNQSSYYQQVALLVRTLPLVAHESCFALKGGTAINLFVRDFPRLSVDIDLAYLPLERRAEALANARAALARIRDNINKQPGLFAFLQDNRLDELRVVVTSNTATIKIEVSPVARGTLHKPSIQTVKAAVEDEFGFAEMPVVSLPDLYGGKICAALDRQHPRDLFDAKLLLENESITRGIFVGFLSYMLSHSRPLHEIMRPNWKPLADVFHNEFAGMTREPVELAALEQTRTELINALQAQLTETDAQFLLSFKQGQPDWGLFEIPEAAQLPAIKWKSLNIQKLASNKQKHEEQLVELKRVLSQWLESKAH